MNEKMTTGSLFAAMSIDILMNIRDRLIDYRDDLGASDQDQAEAARVTLTIAELDEVAAGKN